jgi:tRNA-dihydrouridine synthase A
MSKYGKLVLRLLKSFIMNILKNSPIIAIAPMMDWTDRHCRFFLRQMSRHVLLYTEMITAQAIIHGNRDHLLAYHPEEHPLAIQLGGSTPEALAMAAIIAEDYGYSEINLNVGCPSDRVQEGRFGACLMAEPLLVAECIAAIQAKVKVPVTVKTRIGIDAQDSYEHLHDFIETVAQTGCDTFIIHARKAWLQGLSPKENREIPPLDYPRVYQLKQDFTHLKILINGGITTYDEISHHLLQVDGVMIGRAAYHNPYLLAEIDQRFYHQDTPIIRREAVIENMLLYIQQEMSKGVKLNHITRHMLGLFYGVHGGKRFRRYLSEHAYKPTANEKTLWNALRYAMLAETV